MRYVALLLGGATRKLNFPSTYWGREGEPSTMEMYIERLSTAGGTLLVGDSKGGSLPAVRSNVGPPYWALGGQTHLRARSCLSLSSLE